MEFCIGGSDHRPVSKRLSSHWEAKKAKIRAELLARRERQILEEEVRRELGLEREMMFRCCHGEREETLPVASSWDKFYDYEPDVDGLRRNQMGSLDRLTVDVGLENSSALREAKKAKIRAELLARRERQVLEEEVRRELGLEREMMFRCCHGERDDGSLVPRLGFEGRHLPSFVEDTLRRSPAAALPDLMLRPAVKRSASPPEENVRPLPSFPDFLPLDSTEPEPSSRPSLVVVDSVSKPCVEPVSSPPKPVPMVTDYKPGMRPVPEYKPLSNNYSGNKRKFACDICQITTTSKESLDDHFNGKRHKALIASNNSSASTSSDTCSSAEAENLNKPKNRAEFLCKVCGLKCNSWIILHAHLKEMKHWFRSWK
ncbi:beta-beta-alpha zinc fingers domain-containing protein [Dioscorea alata]|uniref:Beta-beta-alpha zinc fingers domain-containing protein n=1 Tax=Dioscorea alata TaxID=55571 RepID=A0ACB7VDI9_DIOAL|nr:beta-beta-alpha zinc fingers domain-containing protein [Dioscorea alata]